MGAAGPTQFLVVTNGRIRTFDKTGVLDAALNTTLDNFFSSVTTNGVSDPHVRYNRGAARWILSAIDTPTGSSNKVLIAVSSGSVISSSAWSFFWIPATSGTFDDFDTLGIDEDALYIGVNVFDTATPPNFLNATAYVVRKSSVLGSGPIVFTAFPNLIDGSGLGTYAPMGVDNFDTGTNQGYFIGVDAAGPNKLDMRQVNDPAGTPTISSTIVVPTATTALPIPIPQPGSGAKLDGGDLPRLGNAVIRNGSMWTSHSFEVNAAGAAQTGGGRDGTRWYELKNLTSTPTVAQSGTVVDSSSTNPFSYWMPSIMVSGQGHAALGFSRASTDPTNGFAGVAAAGRLATDASGAIGAPTLLQPSTFSYHPTTSDPERWGDYSNTSLDPADDMTIWTVQEYASATNKWGVRVVQLLAPAPTVTSVGSAPPSTASTLVTVTGTGLFEPGATFSKHLTATATGGIIVNHVNSVTPTQAVLDVNTVGVAAGAYSVTMTNADGQSASHALSITGAQLTPNPAGLAFGNLGVGLSAVKTVTFSNTGSNALTISSVALGGQDASQFVKDSDACSGVALAPSATCAVGARFKPTSLGSKTAGLSVTSDAPGSPQTVALAGTGVPRAKFGASPSSIDFGRQGVNSAGASRTITITNTGTVNFRLDLRIRGWNASNFQRVTDRCSGVTVVPGGRCTFSLRFVPSVLGRRYGALSIYGGAVGPHTVALSGTGT